MIAIRLRGTAREPAATLPSGMVVAGDDRAFPEKGEKEMKPAIRRLFNEENLFLHMEKSHLCLSSATPLAVLSSAPVGGGGDAGGSW